MTEDKGIIRAYSQDRQIYRENSILSTRKTSTQFTRTSNNYYSNRNCPEILSIFNLKNKGLEDRKNHIHQSISSDTKYFNRINYPIQSRSPTPLSNPGLDIDNKQDLQIKFPKVTSRDTSSTEKKIPTTTPRNNSIKGNKNSMPTIKTSIKSTVSSSKKSLETKMPIVSNEIKSKKT